jgi:hypothetical protein
MRPVQQPDGSRLHVQWGYMSRIGTYFVYLFQDRPSNPPRRAPTVVRFEKM